MRSVSPFHSRARSRNLAAAVAASALLALPLWGGETVTEKRVLGPPISHDGPRSIPNLGLVAARTTGAEKREATHEGKSYWKARADEAAARDAEPYPDILRAVSQSIYEARQAERRAKQGLAAVGWRSLGPTTDAGRVRDYEFTPDGSKLYVATANGGIWLLTRQGGKGSDYGSPRPLTDDLPLLSFGSVAVAPSNTNIVYAASGEQSPQSGAKVYGLGTLRSADGGNTWSFNTRTVTGGATPLLPGFHSFDLNVNPTNPNDVLLGTEYGIFRSVDGGANWVNKLAAKTDDTREGVNFARRPDNPNVIWSGLWGGLAYSTDAGETWNVLFEDIATQLGVKDTPIRSLVAIAPSDPNRIYWFVASSTADGYSQLGVFRSDDGGAHFGTALGPPKADEKGYPLIAGEQGWSFLGMAVDPTNPNRIIAGGLDTWRSDDGGVTWTQVAQWTLPERHPQFCHADVDVIAFEPGLPNFWMGTDGGLFRSTDGARTFVWKNDGIVARMFSSLAQHPTDPYRLYAGTQDNGTNRLSGNSTAAWKKIFYGDGYDCAVDYLHPNIVYATNFNGYTSRADDGGEDENSFQGLNCPDSAQTNDDCPLPPVTSFRSRLGMDPTDPRIIYSMTNSVYYTTNGGVDGAGKADPSDWKRIYRGSFCSDGYNADGDCPDLKKNYASCTSISVNPKDGKRVAFGTKAGYVLYTLNDFDDSGLLRPGEKVNAIVWDPDDPNALYLGLESAVEIVTGQGAHSIYYVSGLDRGVNNVTYTPADSGIGVPITYAGGDFLWYAPIDSLAVSPTNSNLMFAGSKYGVFRSTNGGGVWTRFGTDIPATWVSALLFTPNGALIRAATWGRGMWELSTTGGAPPATPPVPGFRFSPATPRPGQTVEFNDETTGGASSWSWTFGDGGTSTLQNPTHVYFGPGNYNVVLTATNAAGPRTASKTVPVSFGTTGTGDAFTYLVPVILTSTGENGAFFTTELTLTNRSGRTLNLTFRVKGTIDTASTYSLPPGQQVQPDVFQFLKTSTGMNVPAGNVVTSLRIEVRGADNLSQFGALARVTTPPNASQTLQGIRGRFGLAFNATPLGRGAKNEAIVYNLQDTSDPGQAGTRSNLACVHAGGGSNGPLTLEITYRNGDTGAVHPSKDTLTLSAFQFAQQGRPLQKRGIRFGYATIRRVSGDDQFVCYGVLNDNLNGDGSFDPMVVTDATSETPGAIIPVIVDTAGFRSEMTFGNRTERKISCLIAVIRFDNPVPDWGYYNFEPGEQTTIPDIGVALREAGFDYPPGSVASVFFQFLDGEYRDDQSDTQSPVPTSDGFVGVRTYATKAGGLFGLAYSYSPLGTAADTEAYVYGLQQSGVKGVSAGTRSNLAVVHALGGNVEPMTLEITYFGPAGQELYKQNQTLQPGQWMQFNGPLEGRGVTNGFARVRRVSGSDQFIAYGVLNDQLNDDGSFDLMVVP